MQINFFKPGRSTRFFLSWFEFGWLWLFRLSMIGMVLALYLNWYKLSVRLMLAPPNSLARHFGWLIFALILVQFLVSLLHEVGHLIAGSFVKLQLHLFGIGPFSFWRDGNKRVFRVQRGLGILNGVAASIPLSDKNLARRMFIFALGGPMMSLITAVVTGMLFWSVVQRPFLYKPVAWLWDSIALMSGLSLLTFLSTMRPGLYGNGYPTDGGRIAILLRGGNRVKSWCAQLMLNAADVNKIRPRLWDSTLVEQATLDQKKSLDAFMGNLTAYYWAIDTEKVDVAERYLKKALDSRLFVSSGSRLKAQLEAAYFYAWYRHDLDEAEKWLAFLGRVPRTFKPAYLRALTAVSFLKNDQQTAAQQLQEGLVAYEEAEHKTGVWLAEQAWLQNMEHSA